MGPKNKLKSYIHYIQAASRIINIKYNSNSIYRVEILKTFVSYYETVNNTLEKWVFAAIRTPYLSIYNFEELDLTFETLRLGPENKRDHTYIAIETRVKGILQSLIDSTNNTLMDINQLKLIAIMSSNGSYIPLKFFYKFELCRLRTENSELL
jgi:hypothetical protein